VAFTRRLSLTRWLTLLVLAPLFPLLVFGGLTLAWVSESQRATADRGQADTTRALALAMDAEIRAWKAALLALAETNELQAGRLQDFHREATKVAERYGGWIGLTDRAGHQALNTARAYGERLPATGVPATVAAVFRERRPAVSGVWRGQMAPLFLIMVAVPVLRDDEVRYALHLSVPPETLNRTLAAQRLPPTWIAGVIDREHRVVARWPHRAERVGQPVVAGLQAAFGSRDHGFVESETTEAREVRAAFKHLEEAPWVVNIAMPLAELRAAWRMPLVGFLALAGLLGLLAVGLATAVSRRIARPIRDLARDSQPMLRGDPIARKPSSRITEVHQLEEALAVGAERAQAYYRERERSARAAEAAAAAAASAQALRESQERIERQLAEIGAIYDSAPVGLCVLDPGLRYLRVNECFAEMVGLPATAVVGRSVGEVCPGLAAQAEALLRQVIETGVPVRDVEVAGTTPAQPGVKRAWIEHWLPLKDARGRVIAVNIVAEEVTARRQAEAALAEQKNLLQTILEQAAEGITVRDAEGRVTFVNAVARRRALRPPEGTPLEMTPDVWGQYLDGDGRPVLMARWPMTRALRGERATEEFRRVAPGGSIVVLNSACPLRNAAGELIGAVAITTDITERNRVESALRQALAQEQAALAENRTLLREVHHRVKNNLQMLCDLMYLQMEALEHPEQHRDLQDAYSRVYAIARLHEQLYKAMQSGRVQLADYLAKLIEGFRGFSSTVRMRFEAPLDPQVSLDMDRAIHAGLIVNELITNSLKHAFPEGGTGEIVVRLRGLEDRLELQVRDDGVGLPPGLALAQARSLGLRIVHILARRLQATVQVESRGGAAFTVTFPLHAEPPVEPRPE
jgi:PAS domain S-box-containing protein